ncbi:MAG: hypothetical protein H0X30_32040 [Anaerolineae bacterium]|nr:hypothetical protein [Anaerolineae bacterium]
MKKLTLGAFVALVLVMAAGVFSVQAAPPTPTPEPVLRPSFTDGRINAYDTGAPVAVFETRKSVPIINDNGVPTTADVVNGVQLLFWDGASAKEVMNVPATDIQAAINKFTGVKSNTTTNTTLSTTSTAGVTNTTATTANSNSTNNANTTTKTTQLTTVNNGNSVLISKVNGYSLYYSKDGYLWVTTPANYEGKVYTFSWQKDF